MKYLFVILFWGAFSASLFSQSDNNTQSKNNNSETVYNFGKAYYLLAKSDNTNNFYVVDFTKFPSIFEKIFFRNLVYKNTVLVSLDSDLNKGIAWFLSHKKYDEATVKTNFDEIIGKTVNANNTMTEAQKNEWITKNTKK